MGTPSDQTPASVGVRNVSGGAQAGGVFFSNADAPNVATTDFIQWTQGIQTLQLFSYDAANRIEYMGKCLPGGDTSDPSWQIYKLFYDGPTAQANLIEMRLPIKAGGGTIPTAAFVHVWNDRASLTYPDPTVP